VDCWSPRTPVRAHDASPELEIASDRNDVDDKLGDDMTTTFKVVGIDHFDWPLEEYAAGEFATRDRGGSESQ